MRRRRSNRWKDSWQAWDEILMPRIGTEKFILKAHRLSKDMKWFYQYLFISVISSCEGNILFGEYPKGWAFVTVVAALFSHLLLICSLGAYLLNISTNYGAVFGGLFLVSYTICFMLFLVKTPMAEARCHLVTSVLICALHGKTFSIHSRNIGLSAISGPFSWVG